MGAYTLELSMEDYLNKVLTSNLGLACEKLNLNIAEADEEAARVFTDPTLAVEYADNDDHRMQMGRSVSAELGYTWAPRLPGARVNLARSEKELQKALLNDFLRNLRFEALSAYYEARKYFQTARAGGLNIDAALRQLDTAEAPAVEFL